MPAAGNQPSNNLLNSPSFQKWVALVYDCVNAAKGVQACGSHLKEHHNLKPCAPHACSAANMLQAAISPVSTAAAKATSAAPQAQDKVPTPPCCTPSNKIGRNLATAFASAAVLVASSSASAADFNVVETFAMKCAGPCTSNVL